MASDVAFDIVDPPAVRAVSPRALEIGGFALFLGAVMIVQIVLSSPKLLLGRYFWQDEQFTYFIASDPSIKHMFEAVREGADTNPPVYHLLVRGFAAVVPGRPEVVYRLFSLLAAWLGLIALYVILRRGFEPLSSVIAVLAIWASPLILHESFDARFYTPLLASAAAFCLVFTGHYRRWVQYTLIALAAALLCTIHYFGIVALCGIVAGEFILRPGNWRDTARTFVPTLAGPVALACMIPFLLGQRAGLSVSTWVPSFRPDDLLDVMENLFVTLPLATVVICWWLFHWLAAKDRANSPIDMRAMAGLTGLILVPVAVTVFSAVAQPAMIPKYMIPAMLAAAPIVALLATAGPRWGRAGLVVIMIGLGLLQLRHEAWVVDDAFEVAQKRLIASCEKAVEQGLPVVATSRKEAYTLYYAAPKTRGHVYIADIRPMIRGEVGHDLMRHLMFETDFAAKYQRIYPVPALISVAELKKLGPFYLVGWTPWVAAFEKHVPLKHMGDDVYAVQ
jgi:hypothetical protein